MLLFTSFFFYDCSSYFDDNIHILFLSSLKIICCLELIYSIFRYRYCPSSLKSSRFLSFNKFNMNLLAILTLVLNISHINSLGGRYSEFLYPENTQLYLNDVLLVLNALFINKLFKLRNNCMFYFFDFINILIYLFIFSDSTSLGNPMDH